jgi:glycerophosphoryl diester phosphodiesterase
MSVAIGDLQDIEFSDNISIEEANVTPELVDKMHRYGKKVFCWTVDEEDTIQYLVSCGIDVIGTDNPMMVTAALDEVDYSGGLPRMFYLLLNVFARMEK